MPLLLIVYSVFLINFSRAFSQFLFFSLSQVPPMSQTCGITNATVHLSCGDNHTDFNVVDTVTDFSLSADSCWDQCDVSFTYYNSIGMSPTSNTVTLSSPTTGQSPSLSLLPFPPLSLPPSLLSPSFPSLLSLSPSLPLSLHCKKVF